MKLIILFIGISISLLSFTHKEKNPFIGEWQMKIMLLQNDTIFFLSKPEYTLRYYQINLRNSDTSATYNQEIEKKSMALYQSFSDMRLKITANQIQPFDNNNKSKQVQSPVEYQFKNSKLTLVNTTQFYYNFSIEYLKKDDEIITKDIMTSIQMVNIYSKVKKQ